MPTCSFPPSHSNFALLYQNLIGHYVVEYFDFFKMVCNIKENFAQKFDMEN